MSTLVETDQSDVDVVARAATVLGVPREAPADSFVLHAPLELAARFALLPRVRPEGRPAARSRIDELAAQFEATGPAVGAPGVGSEPTSTADGAERLVAAIDAGDLDETDRLAAWLGRETRPDELARLLSADVRLRLSAAAHAPIFLYHLPRVSPRGELSGDLLRGLAREMARYPDWRLHWTDDLASRRPGHTASPDDVFEALAGTPQIGPPASTFIFPLMSQVDTQGVAESVVGSVVGGSDDIVGRGRAVLRAAAWSMLLEPPDHAPYGWSHCLTLPQAVLGTASGVADPQVALAVAGTYVVGFRAALAQEALEPVFRPADPDLELAAGIDAGPDAAAAVVWHAPPGSADEVIAELVTRAATHHDAHFVKYTLACLDAAADDPAHRRVYLAAAARLAGWWAAAS